MVYYARWGVALAGAVAMWLPGAASASPSAVERAAVHAYLSDIYANRQAELANAVASKAGLDAVVSSLSSECAGVLAGAPQEPRFEGPPARVDLTARQQGEANRAEAQLHDLEYEMGSDLEVALTAPDRSAELTLARQVKAIDWGRGPLRDFGQDEARRLEASTRLQAPAACADMKAWTASGYKLLSPASRALVQQRESQAAKLFGGYVNGQLKALIAIFTAPSNKPLLRKIVKVASETRKVTGFTFEIERHLKTVLGLASHERENSPPPELVHPHAHAVKLIGGKTAAGTKYAIWLKRERGPRGRCLTVRYEEAKGSSSSGCAPSSGKNPEPSVECDEGLLVVESRTLPATRRVLLRLSDGAQIDSRPGIVPKRLGARTEGFYYQAVRGPSPIPVALIELGAEGKLLRVVKLPRVLECTKNPIKYLPGGVRVLVRATAPRGPNFLIAGERYRDLGKVYFKLQLATGPAARQEIGHREGEGGPLLGPLRSFPVHSHDVFEEEAQTGCHPYEYAIVYGLLRKPRDRVFVKVAGKLEPLRTVKIPTSLHAGSVLAYGAFASAPEAIVVRTPAGKTVQFEDRRREATETKETCEGEAEGSGPTVGSDNGGAIFIGG